MSPVPAEDPPTALVILPQGDDDLHAALVQLEELLLSLIRLDDLPDDEQVDLGPATSLLASRDVADVVGTLAIAVDPDRPPLVQPLVGAVEVMALGFLTLPQADVDRLLGAIDVLLEPPTDDLWGAVRESSLTVDLLRRLGRVLRLDHGADLTTLARLDPPPPPPAVAPFVARGAVERVVLVAAEVAAYDSVTRRVLDVWHQNDPLMRYLYRG